MDCLEKEDALFLSLLFLYNLGWLCDGINSLTVLMSGVWIRGGFFQGFFVWLIRAKNVVVCFLSLLMPRANSKLPSPKTKMQNSLIILDIHPCKAVANSAGVCLFVEYARDGTQNRVTAAAVKL